MNAGSVARSLTNFLNPFVVFTALYVTVAFVYSDNVSAALVCITLELSAAGVVAGYVLWMRRRRRVGDFWISTRTERLVPAIVLLTSFAGLLVALLAADAPGELFRLTLSMGLAAALVAAVTFVWKASAHTAVAGHAAIAGVLLLGVFGLPFVVALPLVVWARVEAKAHTLAQALAGAAVGGMLVLIFLL